MATKTVTNTALDVARAKTGDLKRGADRRRQIDVLLAEVNKEAGGQVAVVASDMLSFGRLSTGSPTWDVAMGGGFRINCAHEIIANESQGKTTLILKVIVAAQTLDPEFQVLWVAAEPFDTAYAVSLGVDIGRVRLIPTSQMEVAFETAKRMQRADVFDMLVIDSLPTLVPSEEYDKDFSEQSMTLAARLIGRYLRSWQLQTNKAAVGVGRPMTLFVVNQWREKPGISYGNPLYTPGGKQKNYIYASRVELRRDSDLSFGSGKDQQIVGIKILLKTIKNKTFPPKRSATADFYFSSADGLHPAYQFDTASALYDMGVMFGIIDTSGWPTYGTLRAQGRDKFLAEIAKPENLGAVNDLMDQVMLHATRTGASQFTDETAIDYDALPDVTPERAPNLGSDVRAGFVGAPRVRADDTQVVTRGRRRSAASEPAPAKPVPATQTVRAATKDAGRPMRRRVPVG